MYHGLVWLICLNHLIWLICIPFFLCSPNHLLSGVVALAFDESSIQRPSWLDLLYSTSQKPSISQLFVMIIFFIILRVLAQHSFWNGVLVNPFLLLTSLLWLCWFRAIKVETVDSLNFKAGCIQANYLNGGVRLYKLIVWLVTAFSATLMSSYICDVVFALGGSKWCSVEWKESLSKSYWYAPFEQSGCQWNGPPWQDVQVYHEND